MINLCFGMKVINVTQLPGGSYSHANMALDLAGSDSGIDYWYAMGRWRVVGFFGLAGTILFTHVDENGQAEPVHCADGVDRIVTLALTHSATKYVPRPAIGRIYENGIPMYEEGMMGQATGNHIHCEVAVGVQTTKFYDSTLKIWRMSGELNPVSTIFINTSFSTVKSTLGANFKYVSSIEQEGDERVELKEGYTQLTYRGATLKIYKLSKKETLKMYSAGSKHNDATALNYITNIGTDKEKLHAKANMNYFQMKTGQADAYGQHYGVEYSDLDDFAPKQPGWACFAQLKNGDCWAGLSNDFYYTRNDCIFACSPYAITIHSGRTVNIKSTAAGNKDNQLNEQTGYFMDSNGAWHMVVTPTKCYPSVITDFAKEYDAWECFIADSGGSSQMIVNGEKKQYTGRKIPNILAAAEPLEPAPEPDEPDTDELEKLRAENEALKDSLTKMHLLVAEAMSILEEANDII